MATHNTDHLLWVRHCPQSMLARTTTLTPQAELAHRRLADYAWSANPWLSPSSPAFLVVTRLSPDNLEGVLDELKSIGWRIRNHAFFNCELNAVLIQSRALRAEGKRRAESAARTRWSQTPDSIGRKRSSQPMLEHCSSIAQALPEHPKPDAQALLGECTDRPTDRQTDQPTDQPTLSTDSKRLTAELSVQSSSVAAASQFSGSPPLQEGKDPNPTSVEERRFLASLNTTLSRYNPDLASTEMTNWGGWWRHAFRTNPGKSRRVLADLGNMIAERRIISNPGAAALDLWKRLPD